MPAAPDATDLAAQLQALEAALQSQAVRADGARLAALLADEFIEFGSSGNIWTRAATLADGPWFRLDRVEGTVPPTCAARYAGAPLLAIPLSAGVSVAGDAVTVGECALAAEPAAIDLAGGALCLLAQPCERRD